MILQNKPDPDSQFRLLPCPECKSEDVVYVHNQEKQLVRVRCRFCGKHTPWFGCCHDAQARWNEVDRK